MIIMNYGELKNELRGMGISYEQFSNYDVHLQSIIIKKCLDIYSTIRNDDKEVFVVNDFNRDLSFEKNMLGSKNLFVKKKVKKSKSK